MSDLKTLAEGLISSDLEVREEAARELAERADPKAAAYLLHALDDDAPEVRMWGAYGLGLLERPVDADRLGQALASDPDPVVRSWAAFALARAGSASALAQLAGFLGDPSFEARSNAADALASLELPDALPEVLTPLLHRGPPSRTAWVAALLHRSGVSSAFEAWRDALASPEGRLDAAAAAPLLGSADAARALLRLLGELSMEELDAPAEEDGPPLAEALSAPLRELDLDGLFEQADADPELHALFVLVLARGASVEPEVFDRLHEFLALQPSEAIGRELSALLAELAEEERPALLSNVAALLPDAIGPTLETLELDLRKKLFARLVHEVRTGGAVGDELEPLVEAIRESKYAEAVSGLPASPAEPADETDPLAPVAADPDEDDGMVTLVERLAAGDALSKEERARAEQFLEAIGSTAEEYLAQLAEDPIVDDEAPGPAEVAARALALAAVIERFELESRLAAGQRSAAEGAQAATAGAGWLERESLDELLSERERELLGKPVGAWNEDDLDEARLLSEELAVLVWALGKGPSPKPDVPTTPTAPLQRLPLGKPAEPFLTQAELVDEGELDAQADRWFAWLGRAEQETIARQIETEGIGDVGLDIDALLEGLAAEGFDRGAIEKERGREGMVAEALRFLGRVSARRLQRDGGIASLAAGDFPFEGKPFREISEDALAGVLAVYAERARALDWLTTGNLGDEALDDEAEE